MALDFIGKLVNRLGGRTEEKRSFRRQIFWGEKITCTKARHEEPEHWENCWIFCRPECREPRSVSHKEPLMPHKGIWIFFSFRP
jgi:hypothetical protein